MSFHWIVHILSKHHLLSCRIEANQIHKLNYTVLKVTNPKFRLTSKALA